VESDKLYRRKLQVLYGILWTALLAFLMVLYRAQVVNGQAYYEQSTSKIPIVETVEASRGILTDRNGKVLVSNRQIYTITFDRELLEKGDDENAAILRLTKLCRRYGIRWEGDLPVTEETPYRWAISSATRRSRLQRYLASRSWSDKELTEEDPYPVWAATAAADKARRAYGDRLTAEVLMSLLREEFEIDPAYTDEEARQIIAVRYELELRKLTAGDSSILFAEDVPTKMLSEITDGNYAGVRIGTSSVRQYETDAAAHVLGYIDRIWAEEWEVGYEELTAQGYEMDDLMGKAGVEKAFEAYLRGVDGQRIITTDENGRVTGEVYSVEPEPGGTVALTLDIDFQKDVEEILAARIEEMNKKDGLTTRGGAAVVLEVGTGDALAIASYPSYDPAQYFSDYNQLLEDPGNPFFNRATQGTYAPGSTFKPLTAVAALESGTVTATEKIMTRGIYTYYAPSYTPKCWIYPGSHGSINVSRALTDSCNYFFYDVGRRMGIETLVEYADAFGLGRSTGIEIGDKAGVMDGPEHRQNAGTLYVGGDTLQIAIGQGQSLFTPLQLASYIATLVGGGERYEVHLLKNVRSYTDNALLEVYEAEPAETVELSESTVAAVKEGMGDLVTSGSVAQYFRDCVVTAGAKTGSAQVGTTIANGVFVAFAPFEDPEIAVAAVIEKGGSGAALASTVVSIINAYFEGSESGGSLSEGVLLP